MHCVSCTIGVRADRQRAVKLRKLSKACFQSAETSIRFEGFQNSLRAPTSIESRLHCARMSANAFGLRTSTLFLDDRWLVRNVLTRDLELDPYPL